METSCSGVFAAGDVCTVDWIDGSPHWFQMRLWTQASASHCLGRALAGKVQSTVSCKANS